MTKRTLFAALAALAMVVATEAPAAAQAQFGAQVSYAEDFDLGIGARAQFGLAQLGVENLFGIASVDYFFPDCGAGDCNYIELNANGAISLPEVGLPIYAGGGLNVAHASFGDFSNTEVGLNILGGVQFPDALGALTPFAEARFELSGGEQFLITGGILF
ncbi:MAG TPA: hypothetical protein VFI91_14180 [Longimicrobiaceae bacterium]|nr:hypothetical protein [Longimicrobiaceae bacterium]